MKQELEKTRIYFFSDRLSFVYIVPETSSHAAIRKGKLRTFVREIQLLEKGHEYRRGRDHAASTTVMWECAPPRLQSLSKSLFEIL